MTRREYTYMNFQTGIGNKTKGRGSPILQSDFSMFSKHTKEKGKQDSIINKTIRKKGIKWIQKVKSKQGLLRTGLVLRQLNFSDRIKSSVFKVRGPGS